MPDLQQIGESVNAALPLVERVGGIVTGGVGLWLIQRLDARRERRAKERADAAKAKADEDAAASEREIAAQTADHGLASAARKDAITEWQEIASRRQADFDAYRAEAHQIRDAMSGRMNSLQADHLECEKRTARLEEQLKASESAGAEMRKRLETLERRLQRLEKRDATEQP